LPERQGKPSVIENARALKRVQKESVKVKDVLSANRAAEVKISELLDGVTLKMTLPRTTFEEKSEHLLSRVEKPVLDALKQADMTMDDIDQVELVGGGLRIPKVHDLIKEAVNKPELQVHLNGDEAMSFGSSYIASNSSSSFKVRKVFLTQHPAFEY
jgi:hypoxia up-regulated 1